jgi:uncharacterized protein (UPF0335 family)
MSKKTPMKETDADRAVTKAALENSGEILLQHVEGMEEIITRIDDLKEQLGTKYAGAKSDGYDKKAIKQLIKRRSMTPEQIKAQGELALVVTVYEAALTSLELVELFGAQG